MPPTLCRTSPPPLVAVPLRAPPPKDGDLRRGWEARPERTSARGPRHFRRAFRTVGSMQFSTNPAYDRVLADDRNYHIVFLVVGGFFTLLLLLFSVFSWIRFKRARRHTFERRTYFSFGIVNVALDLFMAL